MTIQQIQDLFNQGGAYGLLVLFIVGLWRTWWYLGREVRELRRERDFWREAFLSGQVIAKRSLSLAQDKEREAGDE